jgi:hypothetical protein
VENSATSYSSGLEAKPSRFPFLNDPIKESVKQRTNRDKFREATQFAHLMMEDEDKKLYYKKLAKKLKVPNAYTAAITDYMRKPEVGGIDAKQYKGKPGGEIIISASKKGISLERVDVIISSPDNEVIEYGTAERGTISAWGYRSNLLSPTRYTSYRITITASDSIEQSDTKTFVVEGNVSS